MGGFHACSEPVLLGGGWSGDAIRRWCRGKGGGQGRRRGSAGRMGWGAGVSRRERGVRYC